MTCYITIDDVYVNSVGVFVPTEVFNWIKQNTCPKGWGKGWYVRGSARYHVSAAQGYDKYGGSPIYSTVTKYRDTVYNYTAGRIAKA